jgi:hypothetical protein
MSNSSGLLSSGTLTVAYGGTGTTSFTSNGIVYGNGTGALQVTAAGTAGQMLFADTSGAPIFKTVSGDLSSSASTVGSVTVSKLQGTSLSLSSLASGDVIQYDGTNFVNGHITNSNLTAGSFSNITGVGALSSGSIASGFGSISTTNNITTTAAVQGATVTATGALQGDSLSINAGAFAVDNTGAITAATGIAMTGNFSQTGAGTFDTGTGTVSLNGATSVTGSNSFTVGTGATSLGGTLGVAGLTT